MKRTISRLLLCAAAAAVVTIRLSENSADAAPPPPHRTADDAITPAQKDPKRHEQFLKQAAAQPDARLLFLGSSSTDFWPARGRDSWEKFATYHPLNFGVSGDRTEHVIWRITHGELEGIHPKVIVIQIGTNNIGHSTEEKPEWAAEGIAKIVQIVREKLPESKILLLGIFPCGDKNSHKRLGVAAVNAIIAKMNAPPNVRYLDISANFLNADGDISPEIMADKQHPTAKGYEIWYEKMLPLLDELMK